MKTFALIFLSLFLTKSCQSKNESTEVASIVETTTVADTTKAEIIKTEEVKVLDVKNQETETEEVKTLVTDNKTQESNNIEYTATTRGFYKKIKLVNNQLTISKDRDNPDQGKVVTLSKAEVSEIATLLKAVNLEGLATLKSPTEKRFYDGAAQANFDVVVQGKKYESAAFDHKFPPAGIEKIVNKLIAIADKHEE